MWLCILRHYFIIYAVQIHQMDITPGRNSNQNQIILGKTIFFFQICTLHVVLFCFFIPQMQTEL